jgi:transposase
MLLQAFYSIRSERQLMERLEFDLLFRWFVGLGIDDAVFDHSVFSKNRDRLLEGEIAAKFLNAVLARPRMGRTTRRPRAADATKKRTSTARNARTRRMLRGPIPKRGSIAKVLARRRSSASSVTR